MIKYWPLFLLLSSSVLRAQTRMIEFGMGTKYDVFKITQPENVFSRNFDIGALAFVSYSQPINKTLNWEAGLATNNYKLNFKVQGTDGTIYSQRELVSVMQSNRLFFNIQHLTKQLNPKWSWVNSFGISLLIGAKNPYDVILQRSKEIETTGGTKYVDIRIKTFGLTGSAILVGANSKVYYLINKDFKMVGNLGFISSMGQLTKVEVDYVFGSSSNYKKAIFKTNGFAPMLTFGLMYGWGD